jgi:hypothetical protein
MSDGQGDALAGQPDVVKETYRYDSAGVSLIKNPEIF